jgi:hypothetical protein
MQKLQADIYLHLCYKIKIFKAKKHQSSLNKEAGIVKTNHYTMKEASFNLFKVFYLKLVICYEFYVIVM